MAFQNPSSSTGTREKTHRAVARVGVVDVVADVGLDGEAVAVVLHAREHVHQAAAADLLRAAVGVEHGDQRLAAPGDAAAEHRPEAVGGQRRAGQGGRQQRRRDGPGPHQRISSAGVPQCASTLVATEPITRLVSVPWPCEPRISRS